MFRHLLAITVIAAVTQIALADSPTPPIAPVTTVEEDISETNSTQKITWDRLADVGSSALAKVNATVRADLVESACGASEEPDRSYDYDATAKVIELNDKYIAYTVTSSSYCGGAHPNYGTYHLTFDAKTGEKLDLGKEVPLQNYDGDNVDWDARDKYQQELAEIMLREAKASNSTAIKDTECYEDLSDAEVVEQIKSFWPSISGLAPGNKVMTSTSPPHVATPCQFDLPVPLEAVEKFLAPDSKIKELLK
ncbi:MAG: hypothetical protein K0R29_2349 [Pseudobdellovibrio sp.]|jgi:hypothetical protein|nr:hypothetical protein [Pseudobdellovibrio sp.]